MLKKKWVGVVGFLLLFYLIIWGFFKLMFSSLGPDAEMPHQPVPVIILQLTADGGAETHELNTWLKREKNARVTLVTPVEFMELPVSPGSTIVVPPSGEPGKWIFAGLPTLIRLGEWADSGASILSFNRFPRVDTTKKNGEKITIAQGFYQVEFTECAAPAVLWFDCQEVAPDIQNEAIVKATITIGHQRLPVIWEDKSGRGKITTCLARPQSTPGAWALLQQLINGDSLHPGCLTTRVTPMVFGDSAAVVLNHHLQALLSGSQADQINSIAWLAQHRYPPARYAIVPALFNKSPIVAMAAAEALAGLEAINALEAIGAAKRIQPVEVRPMLENAEKKLTELLDPKDKKEEQPRG